MTVGFGVLGALLLWRHKPIYPWFLGAAAAFLVLGLLIPISLKYVYKGWMKLAEGLAWFNTRLILSLVFFVIFTPAGIILRLFGKDRLALSWKRKSDSYWVPAHDSGDKVDKKKYERMF